MREMAVERGQIMSKEIFKDGLKGKRGGRRLSEGWGRKMKKAVLAYLLGLLWKTGPAFHIVLKS